MSVRRENWLALNQLWGMTKGNGETLAVDNRVPVASDQRGRMPPVDTCSGRAWTGYSLRNSWGLRGDGMAGCRAAFSPRHAPRCPSGERWPNINSAGPRPHSGPPEDARASSRPRTSLPQPPARPLAGMICCFQTVTAPHVLHGLPSPTHPHWHRR